MNVDSKTALVFKGFLNLDENQKANFQRLIAQYQQGNIFTNQQIRESVNASVTKLQTGPYRETCGCCGR